ncbi:TetR/AcrR family transcriptional regulator [Parasporobacterium paucivorans]|uniref:Transcriptional regulator, TetR family n=1 Tax=Parasporobacterium paucivorans DSM 15970 TaxID=1122934 RepID=A0A1M6IQC7_9FIRM|nr:TetR-like C-terminal domain-containing protein [Parasporobacterium paucivorans]SHJ36627.1 transcriptional regulator, TetR family [Parasporobacterium paucivorans DSM 15970]
MEEKKIDRRVRRTKRLLLNALIQLMSGKKINKITVKELTDLADVNRATFYLYYRDIYDMVDQVETEMLSEFTVAYKKYSSSASTYEEMMPFITYVFEFVKNNSEMCKILLGPDGNYSFIQKFREAINNSQPLLLDTSSKIKLNYYKPFIISGCIGVIQKWLENGMDSSPDEMAKLIIDF